jgi:hypothetical protein
VAAEGAIKAGNVPRRRNRDGVGHYWSGRGAKFCFESGCVGARERLKSNEGTWERVSFWFVVAVVIAIGSIPRS